MKERAELGIDGTHAFALLGEDLQEGEVEFVEVKLIGDEPLYVAELRAARRALANLRLRLGRFDLNYWFGPSHPYGS